jgi:hypothetical protein
MSRIRRVLPLTALVIAASCTTRAPELQPGDLIQIEALSRTLADSTAPRPLLLQVGFAPLYRSGHLPGSRYVGPGSKPEGLASLTAALKDVPPDQPIVLYCGCCPWTDCPNVRPAFTAAKQSGHRNVRVLYVSRNLERDWIDQGLPSVRGE